MSKAKSVVK